MAETIMKETKRAEDLLIGALAVLALKGVDTLRLTDKAFHARFGRALEIYKSAGGNIASLAAKFYHDRVTESYDELDHSLIAAEQFGLVKFPNPSYNRLQITISPRVAEQILSSWGDERAVVERAAKALCSTAVN